MPGPIITPPTTTITTTTTTGEITNNVNDATPSIGTKLNFFSRVNHRLLVSPKIIFFCIGALYYVFYSFRMEFIKEYLGLPEHVAGLLQAFMQLASFFGVTGWSNLADYRGIHKRLLVSLCLAMATIFQVLLLAPFLPPAGLLALSIIVMVLFGLVLGGVMPLADYHILKLLKEQFRTDPQLYGRQVLWGTAASGLTTYGIGSLIDLLGVRVIFFILPVIACLAALAVAFFGYPDRSALANNSGNEDNLGTTRAEIGSDSSETTEKTFPPEGDTASTHSTSVRVYVATMLRPRFLLFLLMVLPIGVGRQIATTFLPYYLSKEIGLSGGKYGSAYLGSSLLTILLLYCGPLFLSRLSGHTMLLVGLGAMTLRLTAYTLLTPSSACPWQTMIIEMFSSISFAFTQPAGVREAAACAPPGWEAAFQAVYTCAYVQFPAVFGSILGGLIYRKYGGAMLMRVTALYSALSLALIILLLTIRKMMTSSSLKSFAATKPRATSTTG